jgi:carbohydrate kinase (thermoresistant glucokinase family)
MNPPRLVIMGVSGCGKSTVASQLAQRLQLAFVEGDALHSPHNVARMAAGIALTDEDRKDWLDAIAQQLQTLSPTQGMVISCSALKRAYRDRLRAACTALQFVHLHGTRALLDARLRQRQGHYMPATLLDSQLATLEMPTPDEHVLQLDMAQPIESLLQHIEHSLTTSHD